MSDSRKEFEAWYVTAAFDYERNPIGSRECGLQWAAWRAARRAALEEAASELDQFGPAMSDDGVSYYLSEMQRAIRALAAQAGQEGKPCS